MQQNAYIQICGECEHNFTKMCIRLTLCPYLYVLLYEFQTFEILSVLVPSVVHPEDRK